MTTIGMHYDVVAGKENEFESAFYKVLDLMKTLPGHVESHLFQDVQSKGSYMILSQWENKEDFEKFTHSDAFKNVVDWGKSQILRGRPRHKVYLNQ